MDMAGPVRSSPRSLSLASFDAEEPGGCFQSHFALTQACGNKTKPSCVKAASGAVVSNAKLAIDHCQNLHFVWRERHPSSSMRLVKLHRKERMANQRAYAGGACSFEIGANQPRFEVVKINAGQ